MPTDDQFRVTAVHESAHAIGYLSFGLRFGSVKIWQGEAGDVKGRVTVPAGRHDLRTRAIICLAGPCAELVLTGVPLEEQPGSHNDLRMAQDVLDRLEGAVDIATLVPHAQALVETNWPSIEFTAGLLLESGELGYSQLLLLFKKELVRRNCRW